MITTRNRQGVQSVEVGMRLVRCLAAAPQALTLKALAAAAEMPAAKAHRYLVSLGRAGLIEQDAISGRYDLGPLALQAGLAALGRLEPIRLAEGELVRLRDAIDETVALAVWGNRGPVFVRWEEASRPVTVNVRIGSVVPLASSSTGRLFAALLPGAVTAPLIAAEFAPLPDTERAAAAARLSAIQADVRARQMARVEGDLLPGVSALSAPIFDHQGRLVLALTALGHQGVFDAAWDGRVARALRAAAETLSARLGR